MPLRACELERKLKVQFFVVLNRTDGRCLQCCLKCPGGVCTKACNKMLLKEIFAKMYKQNKNKIKKLEFFMKENKRRINKSEQRISKCDHPSVLLLCTGALTTKFCESFGSSLQSYVDGHHLPSSSRGFTAWSWVSAGRQEAADLNPDTSILEPTSNMDRLSRSRS